MNRLNRKLYLPLLLILVLLLAACAPVAPAPATESTTAPVEEATAAPVEEATAVPTTAPTAEPTAEEATDPMSMTRETGATVTVQSAGDITVHSYLAPQQAFASNTHILELPNSLVLIDTQFLLPNALDFRAYADSLDKPIDRLIITHAHPDHFLGSEAFADVDVYALAEVAASIEANGQAEVDEKQAEFGPAIAGSFVVPQVLEPGTVEIDGVDFVFERVTNAEAEVQAVTKLPDYGIVSVGDIVYSGIHLILAGPPPTWIEALENLKAEGDTYPIVLPGHGATTDPSVYDANIAWLMKAGELMGTATSGEEFKAGLVEAFPELGMEGAIDFVLPFLFPDDGAQSEEPSESSSATVTIRNAFQAEMTGGNEMIVEEMTVSVSDEVEYDGIIFDIDVSESSISLVFDVSERARRDPTGVIAANVFERYYIRYDGLTVVAATVDESSVLMPTVEIIDGELLIEFSEGMELGDGRDVLIHIETE